MIPRRRPGVPGGAEQRGSSSNGCNGCNGDALITELTREP